MVAALWIDTIATELVSIIEYLGLLSGINHTVSFVSRDICHRAMLLHSHEWAGVCEQLKRRMPAICPQSHSREPALTSFQIAHA